MNWLDGVIGLILVASVVTSFRKGLSREVIGLVSVVLAILMGLWFYAPVAGYLSPHLTSRLAANLLGFAIVFCGVLLLGSIVSAVVGRFLRVTGLSFVDHLLGLGFGVLRGILIAVAVVTGIMAFAPADRPPAAVVNSRLSPYVVDGARVISAMAPYELKEGFRKSYARVKSAWEKASDRSSRDKAAYEREI